MTQYKHMDFLWDSGLLGRKDVHFRALNEKTDGAATTIMYATQAGYRWDDSIIVVNSDNVFDYAIFGELQRKIAAGCDGAIMLFDQKEPDPKWSYAQIEMRDDAWTPIITRVAEKNPISAWATAGLYYFRHLSDFKDAYKAMSKADDRVNGELYLAPVYNYMINAGGLVEPIFIRHEQMIGLGTPNDLRHEEIARRLTALAYNSTAKKWQSKDDIEKGEAYAKDIY